MLTPRRQQGATLIETLVALLIVAFGLMALAGLQTTMNAAVFESFQRTQALTLMQDMAQRLQANQPNAPAYVTASALGTGDSQPADCGAGPATGAARATRDQCEWSHLLKGASETAGSNTVGAMLAGRGCIEQVQAPDPSAGICQPGIYRVTVAWQGMTDTVTPSLGCGQNLYTREALRKVVATQVLVPLPSCS